MTVTKLVDNAGNVIGIASTERDITKRKREAEEASRMVTVVRDSNDAITIQDLEGHITAWNHGAELMYGYGEAEALEMSIGRLTAPGKIEEQREFTRRLLAGEAVTSLETQRVTKDGHILDVWMTVTKLVDNAGNVIGIASTERDITKHKQAEDALRRAHAELEQRIAERTEELNLAKQAAETNNRAKSDFLSNMSHELRTPLGAIIGFSELLDERIFGDLNPKQGEYVKDILESGRYLLSLINDILDLAKIEAGKMDLELSTFGIATLLDSSLVMVKEKCLKRGIQLTTEIADPVKALAIVADERKLKQVMFNLLSNAAKFTHGGGTITVSARLIRHRSSVIGHCPSVTAGSSTMTNDAPQAPLTNDDRNLDEVEVSVSDTGIGIAPEHQGRVFEEFFQVASDAAGKPSGTGLGLALVRRMVEQHGGRVGVDSAGEGRGSTFHFTIPCKI